MPLTVVHGDAHPWNVLTPVTSGEGRAVWLDWEGWSVEPGPHDLVSLIALHLPVTARRAHESELLQRYVSRLQAGGVRDYDFRACDADYRRGIVRRLLSPIGLWSRHTPARDWWPMLEHVGQAFHDLRCDEVL